MDILDLFGFFLVLYEYGFKKVYYEQKQRLYSGIFLLTFFFQTQNGQI